MTIKTITHSELNLLSFPDAQVVEIKMDKVNKLFFLSVDTAYFDKSDVKSISKGTLIISQWEYFSSKIYSSDGFWENSFDELRDICEFTVSDTQIELKGFGKRTGRWTEYQFLKAGAYFTATFL